MSHGDASIEFSFCELIVADWPRAVRWYAEVLGLRVILEDAANQFALLHGGTGRLALKHGERPDGTPSFVRLIFHVTDVDAERARLVGLGIDVGPAFDSPQENYRTILFQDPEGTSVALFSWITGAAAPM